MTGVTNQERDAIAGLDADAMLARTLAWSAVNSGTGNLAGVARMAELLGGAFAALPGEVEVVPATPVERVGVDGRAAAVEHGAHLVLRVRSDASVRMLLTGHMDTVYPADHPFQETRTLADGRVNGPGTADMKGGLSLMGERSGLVGIHCKWIWLFVRHSLFMIIVVGVLGRMSLVVERFLFVIIVVRVMGRVFLVVEWLGLVRRLV